MRDVERLGDAALVSRFTGATAVPAGVILTLIAIRLRGTTRLDYRTRVAWSIITVALMGYGLGALMHFALGTFSVLNVAWPAGPDGSGAVLGSGPKSGLGECG